MKTTIPVRILLFGLTILIPQPTILCNVPEFIRALGIRPRDAYVTLGTAAVLIPSCIIWSNKHHPAALAAKQFDAQREEGRRLAREAQALEDQRKLIREHKVKAERLLQHTKHIYESEINLIPNNGLVTQKDAFFHIIKSNHNTHPTPLTYYAQKQANALEELRKIDPNLFDTSEEKKELSQLIRSMERIQQSFNLALADDQKAEQEAAKIEKRKEEAEKRKIEKENLEIQRIRSKIDNYQQAEKINAHIRTELRRMNEKLDSANTSLYNSELNNVTRAQQSEKNINQFKVTIANLHDAIVKAIAEHTQASATAAKELIKMLNEFKQYLETLGLIAVAPRQPPYNPEAFAQPAPTYPLAAEAAPAGIQPIPVPRQ